VLCNINIAQVGFVFFDR